MVHIQLLQGDIAEISSDAIVNSAPNTLEMSTSVGKALVEAGGPTIAEEAKALAPIHLGDAVETGAGTLKAKYVIHAASKDSRGENRASAESIKDSVRRTLILAEQLNCKSIAFPALGCGEGKFPIGEGIHILLEEIQGFSYTILEEIKIVLFTQQDFEVAKVELRGHEETTVE